MLFNKKGSLEISIQAIVIVVLAMTLLGLGLGFIKGMFKNITSTTEDVSEQVRQRVLDDLIQTDKKISFPKTEVVVDKGGSTVLTVGIRNKGDANLLYKIGFTPVGTFSITSPNWFQYDDSEYTLKPADSEIRNIRLTIPSGVAAGSYFLTFDVLVPPYTGTGSPKYYDQKDFFVVVRG